MDMKRVELKQTSQYSSNEFCTVSSTNIKPEVIRGWEERAGLDEYWYVAARSNLLKKKPLAATVLGRDLVVFRGKNGLASVALDRCEHRGVPLSKGRFTKDGHIECVYHGWQYDGDGKCTHIPSLNPGDPIPENIRIQSFPCEERDGYVWVWMGSESPPTKAIPIPGFDDHHWLQGTLPMKCSFDRAIENGLDPVHTSFLHRRTHSQGIRRLFGKDDIVGENEMRITDTGACFFMPAAESAGSPMPEKRYSTAYFDLPNRMSVYMANMGHQMIFIAHMVPTSENECRMEYLLRNPLGFGPKVVNARNTRILLEDKGVLEPTQKWYEDNDFKEKSVHADTSTFILRRIMRLAGAGQWEAERGSLPQRKVMLMRM